MKIVNKNGGGRLSNFELLRIISMFMVCMIHANMVSLPHPTIDDFNLNPISTIVRYVIESFGIVCVNVFVLISGWFSIKTKRVSVLSFIFQIIFLQSLCFLVMYLLGTTDFTMRNMLHIISLPSFDWFIKAYLVLLILAPILNKFIEHSDEKLQRKVLFWFFVFSSTYGWFGGANRFFVSGYGPLFFIGLYLLAQYVHITINNINTPTKICTLFTRSKYIDLCVYLLSVLVNTILLIYVLKYGKGLDNFILAYNNPIVVVGALYLLLFFSKIQLHANKFINWIAASSFSVYLIHGQVNIMPYFSLCVLYIYDKYSSVICFLAILFFLIFVFLVSILIDQLRIISWKKIAKIINV